MSGKELPPGWKLDWPLWNLLMAWTKLQAGKDTEARPLLETLANPPNPWGNFVSRRYVSEGRARLAALLARQGELDRAEKLLKENRKWNPNWAPTRPAELAVERLLRNKMHSAMER